MKLLHRTDFRLTLVVIIISIMFITGFIISLQSENLNIEKILQDNRILKDSLLSRIIKLKSKNLESFSYDYSFWDEMLEFKKTLEKEWEYENIITVLPNFGANYCFISDEQNKIIYNYNNIDPNLKTDFPLNLNDLNSLLGKEKFPHFYYKSSSGIVELSGSPLQPSSDVHRITKPQGYLFFGRLITDDFISDLEFLTDAKINVIPSNREFDLADSNNAGRSTIFCSYPFNSWDNKLVSTVLAKSDIKLVNEVSKYNSYKVIYLIVFALIVITGLFLSNYFFVNRRLKQIQKSLDGNDLVELNKLSESESEFGRIGKLISEFFVLMKQAEESNRIKSVLFANLSHEFRTPMTAILGFSDLLSESEADAEKRTMAGLIRNAAERLLKTLNSMLDLAQLESGSGDKIFKPTEVNSIIEHVISIYMSKADKKKLKIFKESTIESIYAVGNEKMITEVIDSVIDNAIKFTDKGEIRVKLYCEKNNVIVSVCDTGIGIAEKDQNIIFDEFRQISEGIGRSHEGIGLGLTIAKKMTELMGGSISVISKLNEGSEFKVILHKTESTKSLYDDPGEFITKGSIFTRKELLVLDDIPTMVNLVRAYISDFCNVYYASNANDALALIQEKTFDIILVDINLGSGMNGIQFIKKLRENSENNNIVLIALTGYAMFGDKEKLISEGFNDYIEKPFDKSSITAVLNKYISEKLR